VPSKPPQLPDDPTTEPAADRRLTLPHVDSVTYAYNFIRVAVCELRFPELPSLDSPALIEVLQHLRTDYPLHLRPESIKVELGKVETAPAKHLFKSRDEEWTVALTASSISVETSRYGTFEQLKGRITKVLAWTKGFRDADFFTRVGLRYVNVIPFVDRVVDVTDWVNPALVQPLADGVYGTSSVFVQQVEGIANPGRYIFKHGFIPNAGAPNAGSPAYVFDIDLYDVSVEADRVMRLVEGLHSQSFDLFSWAIGPATRESMGVATPKQVPRSR
jgi:uncharacterized protein (TIGR04255 family)